MTCPEAHSIRFGISEDRRVHILLEDTEGTPLAGIVLDAEQWQAIARSAAGAIASVSSDDGIGACAGWA